MTEEERQWEVELADMEMMKLELEEKLSERDADIETLVETLEEERRERLAVEDKLLWANTAKTDAEQELVVQRMKSEALMAGIAEERSKAKVAQEQLRASTGDLKKAIQDINKENILMPTEKNDPLLRSQTALTKALDQSCVLIRKAGKERANVTRELAEVESNLRISELKRSQLEEEADRASKTVAMLARVDLSQDLLVQARADKDADTVSLMRTVDLVLGLLQGVTHADKHSDPKGNEVLLNHWRKSERDVQYLQLELNRQRRMALDKEKEWKAREAKLRALVKKSKLAEPRSSPPKKSPYATAVIDYDDEAEDRALAELVELRGKIHKEEEAGLAARTTSLGRKLAKEARARRKKGNKSTAADGFWVLPTIGGKSDHPFVDLEPEVTVGRLNMGFLGKLAEDK